MFPSREQDYHNKNSIFQSNLASIFKTWLKRNRIGRHNLTVKIIRKWGSPRDKVTETRDPTAGSGAVGGDPSITEKYFVVPPRIHILHLTPLVHCMNPSSPLIPRREMNRNELTFNALRSMSSKLQFTDWEWAIFPRDKT